MIFAVFKFCGKNRKALVGIKGADYVRQVLANRVQITTGDMESRQSIATRHVQPAHRLVDTDINNLGDWSFYKHGSNPFFVRTLPPDFSLYRIGYFVNDPLQFQNIFVLINA